VTVLAERKQLAVRVPIAAGDSVLRFDFRTVNPDDASVILFVVASVGGAIETASLPLEADATTSPAVIDGAGVTLGPRRTMTIGLPADVHDDVVFARIAAQGGPCGRPPPPVPGIIIDDLRVE
jgi:hypothetical protein